MAKKSLGLVPLSENTIEFDLALLERYQEFSAELLRVALIGITAIGFAISRMLFPDSAKVNPLILPPAAHWFLIAALLALALSAAAALAHRYFAVDSMSWHLQAMRRFARGEGSDVEDATAEFKARFTRFKLSRWAIGMSASALAIGSVLLVSSIIGVIW